MLPKRSTTCTLLVLVACGACVLAAEPELQPGREVRVEAPDSGGYFMLYVPNDYTPKRRWPVIFCYHGQGGKPTSWPFTSVTQGKGFIIVGMEYLEREARRMTLEELDRLAEREVQSMQRVAAYVERRLRVDKRQYFCGGFSKGGWMASQIGEASSGTWAGLAILGAGRQKLEWPMKNPHVLRRKPIYIGCGDKDPNYKAANVSADFYRKHGAKVTFETYEGLGHNMKTDSRILLDWLRGTGPLRSAKERLAAAQKAEKAKRIGRAYALYRELALASDTDESSLAAAEAAKRIEQQAAKRLAEAEQAIAAKRYAEASRLLAVLAGRYERSEFGRRADELIRKLQTDPAIQAALRQGQLDAGANELEARALAAERAADYAKALRLYEQYVARFQRAGRHKAVKARLDALKADKRICAAVRTKEAARECRVWLNLADNYIRVGKPARAKEYLERIVAKYGDTDWAAKARERLAGIE